MDGKSTVCDDIYQITTNLINDHLSRKNVFAKNLPWKIAKSKHGRGLFAARDIEAGEIVFVDHPLIIGPRSSVTENICVSCCNNENLRKCTRNCGLHVCSQECEDATIHRLECEKINLWARNGVIEPQNLQRCLTPIRVLFLSDSEVNLLRILAAHNDPKHGIEVKILKNDMEFDVSQEEEDLMRLACMVLDANAYEVLIKENVPTLRGLFPVAGLMNHSCIPNTMHVFDQDAHMIVRATIRIPKDAEILTTYSRLIWGTLTRRYHLLRTKHFACGCQRCSDPTEFNTLINAIICSCQGALLPTNPLKIKCEWKCQSCKVEMSESNVGFMATALAKRLANLDEDNVAEILDFQRVKLAKLVPPQSQISLELKYKIIWLLGVRKGYLFSDLSEDLLHTKEKFCEDILRVLEQLGLGACKMRGLLLFEIFKCRRERNRRNMSEVNNNDEMPGEIDVILKEAANIYLYDASAPVEVQEFWENNKINTNWRHYLTD